jgi:hypothetical protein
MNNTNEKNILVGRSERGNKQNFILGLVVDPFAEVCYFYIFFLTDITAGKIEFCRSFLEFCNCDL